MQPDEVRDRLQERGAAHGRDAREQQRQSVRVAGVRAARGCCSGCADAVKWICVRCGKRLRRM
eukprot:6111740-Prymnesium_polylepis.1